MTDVLVVPYERAAHHLAEALRWLHQEWGQVDSPIPPQTDAYPTPLFAVCAARLVGVLTFTKAPHPNDPDISATWINTVFVPPSHRGDGIAQQLVKQATERSVGPLWVYTEFPGLYRRVGWHLHRQSPQTDGQSILYHE